MHAMGLKVGIHTLRGSVSQAAVDAKAPVLGAPGVYEAPAFLSVYFLLFSFLLFPLFPYLRRYFIDFIIFLLCAPSQMLRILHVNWNRYNLACLGEGCYLLMLDVDGIC